MAKSENSRNRSADWNALKYRPASVGLSALVILLVMASMAAFAVACGGDPSPTPEPAATTAPQPTQEPAPTTAPQPTPEPATTTAPQPTPEPVALDDDDLSRAFVEGAIEYYGENGLDATVEFFMSPDSIQNDRSLVLLDEADAVLLVYLSIPTLQGQYIGPGSPFGSFMGLI